MNKYILLAGIAAWLYLENEKKKEEKAHFDWLVSRD